MRICGNISRSHEAEQGKEQTVESKPKLSKKQQKRDTQNISKHQQQHQTNHNHNNKQNHNHNNILAEMLPSCVMKRQVSVKTCGRTYEQWRHYKRRYRKAPKDGIEFQIDYVDTLACLPEESRAGAPVALLLHGAPGSYNDFGLLIGHLTAQGVRVLAPNFPEYQATVHTKRLFRHSADEKAEYLRDFLSALQVSSIDLLVSHSSAIFPTLLLLLGHPAASSTLDKTEEAQQQLVDTLKRMSISSTKFEDALADLPDPNNNSQADSNTETDTGNDHDTNASQPKPTAKTLETETETEAETEAQAQAEKVTETATVTSGQEAFGKLDVKAVALLNPAGHRLPMSMKPRWFKCGSVRIYQRQLGRYWFRKLGPAFLRVVGVPVRVDNMDHVMLSATVMRNSRCTRVCGQLEQLSKTKIPTLLVFSENDKLIEPEIFYEMTQMLGLDPTKFDLFDSLGNVDQARSCDIDWIRVMVFKEGGHYAYANYAKTVNSAISELLCKTSGHKIAADVA